MLFLYRLTSGYREGRFGGNVLLLHHYSIKQHKSLFRQHKNRCHDWQRFLYALSEVYLWLAISSLMTSARRLTPSTICSSVAVE